MIDPKGLGQLGHLPDSRLAFTLPAPPAGGKDAEFHPGDRIGPYRLVSPLGRGGMGEVWRAERVDGQLKRAVALKLPMLSARRSLLAQRFERERDILASLSHPHIARLYDAGITDDDQPYLALELVDGLPITDHCQKHALSVRERVTLMLQVMQAAQHAHANLVIHRDLKPGNVLVTPEGQAMLLDFGIAKLLLGDSTVAPETELTMVGGRAMTLEYAAPEQIDGAPISIATDVWALGALLYELVAGRRPFGGEHRHALEQAVLRAEPVRPSPATMPRAAAADLDTIVLKALKKRPFERYATVEAFADDLRRWLDGRAVLAQPDSRGYRLRRFVARHRMAVATSTALAVFLLLAGGFSVQQARVAEQQSQVARAEAETATAVQQFLEGIFRSNSGDQVDPIKARQRTAKELLDEGAARIEKELASAPEAKWRLLSTLSDMYQQIGELDRSAQLLEQRVTVAAQLQGASSPRMAQALGDWAMLLAGQTRVERARQVLQQAESVLSTAPADARARLSVDLAWAEMYRYLQDPRGLPFAARAANSQASLPRSMQHLQSLMALGEMQRLAGQAEASMKTLERALVLAPQVEGGAAFETTLLSAVASAAEELGDEARADQLYRRAQELEQRQSGLASENAAITGFSRASFLLRRQRLKEATVLLGEVRRNLQSLPPSADRDRTLAIGLFHEGRAWRDYGHPERAIPLLQRSMTLGDKAEDDPRGRALLYGYLAEALATSGRLDDAEAALTQLDRTRRAADLKSFDLAYVELRQRVRVALARDHPEQALAAWKGLSTRTDPGPNRLPMQALSAEIALAADDALTAERVAAQVLEELRGPPPSRFAPALERRMQLALGRALHALGRTEEGLPHLETAARLAEATFDVEYSLDVAQAQLALAEALLRGPQAQSARQLLDSVRAIHKRIRWVPADDARRLRRALAGLAGSGTGLRTSR